MTARKNQGLERLLTGGSPKVGIIGQGVVGTMTAQIVCDAGFSAIGYDCDTQRVRRLMSPAGRSPAWQVVDEMSLLADTDVIVIAVRLPISRSGAAEQAPLRKLARELSALPQRDRLIIVETTLPPGATRSFADELYGSARGRHMHVTYCPERLRAGQTADEVRAIPRLVGGLTEDATRLACCFLVRLPIRPVPVSSPEVAELSKLLENAFLTAGICLVGELTRVAHALRVSATEVAAAAATKPDGYLPFWPGAGIGGHCLKNDLRLLQNTGNELRVKAPMLRALSASCAELSSAVLPHLERLMCAHGKTIACARIWVLGVGFKVGSSDTTETPARELVRRLRRRKALVFYSDPRVESFVVDDRPVERLTTHSRPRKMDAALILSGDPNVRLSQLSRRVPIILDLGGARIMSGNRARIATL